MIVYTTLKLDRALWLVLRTGRLLKLSKHVSLLVLAKDSPMLVWNTPMNVIAETRLLV
jgi:hypothetical protein